jgi:hypothetical protein
MSSYHAIPSLYSFPHGATAHSGPVLNDHTTRRHTLGRTPLDEWWYDIILYIFNCNLIDAWWQQYSSHLHTDSTQNTENGTYIKITKFNMHNNKKITNRRRDIYLTTHNTHNWQTAMHPAGFVPTIRASEWLQIHALDGVATDIGCHHMSI